MSAAARFRLELRLVTAAPGARPVDSRRFATRSGALDAFGRRLAQVPAGHRLVVVEVSRMNAVLSADAVSDAILPLLEAAGWRLADVSSPDGRWRMHLYDVTLGLRSVPRLTVTENPRDDRVPLSAWPTVLSLLPASVEQAVAVLGALGILPADDVEDADEPAPPPGCPRCGHRDEQHRFHGCLAMVTDGLGAGSAVDCECLISSTALPQVRDLLGAPSGELTVWRDGDPEPDVALVRAVEDRDGDVWHAPKSPFGGWASPNGGGAGFPWVSILRDYGPLIDATAIRAVREAIGGVVVSPHPIPATGPAPLPWACIILAVAITFAAALAALVLYRRDRAIEVRQEQELRDDEALALLDPPGEPGPQSPGRALLRPPSPTPGQASIYPPRPAGYRGLHRPHNGSRP